MKTKFLITSQHTVHVDTYSDGQTDYIHTYDVSQIVEAETWQNAVEYYLQNVLHFNLALCNCDVDEDENIIMTSCLVDADNYQPSIEDVKLWEDGEITLYCNDINIEVSKIESVILS